MGFAPIVHESRDDSQHPAADTTMRIGINLLYLIPDQVYGTRTYAVSLIKALAEIDHENEYFVFMNRESGDLNLTRSSNFHLVACGVRASHRPMRYAWEQLLLPQKLRSYRIDLVHSLGYVGPLRTPCATVVTVPDLNFVTLRHTLPSGKRAVLQFFSTHAACRANHVITISDFSKGEISRFMKLSRDKITVTHLGPSQEKYTDSSENGAELCRRYGLKKPYIVAFGGGTIHKNIPRLIQAFSTVKEKFPHDLVLIGKIPPNVDLTRGMSKNGNRERIKATGYLPDAHIQPILGHADLFVLPSLYEGFGLPAIEAQQAGVAVACSTAGSLPEVSGEGAVYFDPASVETMARTIERCLADDQLRSRLVLKGRENVKRFSWEKTALETLSVYRNVHQSMS